MRYEPYAIPGDEHPHRAGLRDYRPSVGVEEPRRVRALLWLTLFVLVFLLGFASGSAYGADDRCIVDLQVRPQLMLRGSRGDVVARMRIQRHAHHDRYTLSWTSDVGAGGASSRQLEGEEAAITQDPFWIKGTPGGHYLFTLAVFDHAGKRLEQTTAEIQSQDDR